MLWLGYGKFAAEAVGEVDTVVKVVAVREVVAVKGVVAVGEVQCCCWLQTLVYHVIRLDWQWGG